ncbi:MAG: methyltransferase domain-containing protein [Acidobacteria bacterium]|jgi:ubiquinone/menaquinone biosynthesis C-methylase UbiE|nr:methyltransferase domain-containing protein [Acidobacteriota bacterium]
MQTLDSQTFKTRDATSYDAVTEQFDFFTERLTSPLATHLVSLAEIKPSDSVLDVGTGTGVVALLAAKKIAEGGKVHGIDLSEGMLVTATAKAEKLGLEEKIKFSQMDAENLEFEAETFDAVVSLFALLHFPNPLTALKEIYRVMRPGCRFVVAVGSRPPLFSASGLSHLVKIFPDLVRRKQGRQLVAPGFLDSLVEQHLPKAEEQEESDLASHSHNRTSDVSELIRSAGFKVLQTDWQSHQAQLATPEDFWEIQRTFSSISRKRLSNAAPEKVESLRREFFGQCHMVQSRGGNLVYPFAAFYVVAEKY